MGGGCRERQKHPLFHSITLSASGKQIVRDADAERRLRQPYGKRRTLGSGEGD
jgi:hypothetical protein